MLTISPRTQPSPSQAIIRPLPIIRLMSPSIAKPLSSPMHTPSTTLTNGHGSAGVEQDTGRNSYRVMPSPTTEERHATYVYLNKSNHLVQQEASSSSREKGAIWKKPVNGHHPHVAYIDEDDEGSVSLKSSARGTSTATSSNTASPVLSRKDRSQTLSSSSTSSSSTYSNNFCNGPSDTNQIVLHESSV